MTSLYLVPTSGCDVISSRGTCYKYFTSTGINFADARLQCVTGGYDIASVTSEEENTLLGSLVTSSSCWIGFNDIDNEGTFIWADGTEVTYTGWNSGEPNNAGNEDCTDISSQNYWNDLSCTNGLSCYFCSSTGKI